MENTEIYYQRPEDFIVNVVVAGGFLQHEGQFLMLKRHPEKSYGNFWNLPAGKVELDEVPHVGAQREIHEETGIFIPLEELKHVHTFYLRRGDYSIEFFVYKADLQKRPDINLKMDENTESMWLKHHEATKLPLLGGGAEILRFCIEK